MKYGLLVMMMLLLVMSAWVTGVIAEDRAGAETAPPPPTVGKLVYAGDHKTLCFNDAFAEAVNRSSRVRVSGKLEEVKLHDVKLFQHPMVVMAGMGKFALTDDEVTYLRAYLTHGGFLLASSKCQDEAWDTSFRREILRVLPDAKLEVLPNDHAIMKVMFEIKQAETVRKYEHPLWAVTVEGKVVVLYSPVGLNDAAALGPDCCCCGGNEVRNARWINANALVYAMTR